MERLLNALTGRKKNKKRTEKNSCVNDESTLTPILKVTDTTEANKEPLQNSHPPVQFEREEETFTLKDKRGNEEIATEVLLKNDQLNKPSISRQHSTESRGSQCYHNDAFKTSLLRQTLPARLKQLSIDDDICPVSKETVFQTDLSRFDNIEPLIQKHFKDSEDIIYFADDVEEAVTDNDTRNDFEMSNSGTDFPHKQYEKGAPTLGTEEPAVIESDRTARVLRRQVSATRKFSEVDHRPKEGRLSSENHFRGTVTSSRSRATLTKQDSISQRNNIGSEKLGYQASINRRNGHVVNQSNINRRNVQLLKQGSVNRRNSLLIKQESISIKHYPDVVTNKVGYTGSILSSRRDNSRSNTSMRVKQQSSMENTPVGKRAARLKKQQTLPTS